LPDDICRLPNGFVLLTFDHVRLVYGCCRLTETIENGPESRKWAFLAKRRRLTVAATRQSAATLNWVVIDAAFFRKPLRSSFMARAKFVCGLNPAG
jgi:hypothetical protein